MRGSGESAGTVAAFAHGRLTGPDAALILDRMDERYHAGSRQLQDRFDTRRLADRIDERTGRDHIRPEDREFIERMDMLFLATSDVGGQPQCSYKGGEPGFVHGLDEHRVQATRVFPNCPRHIHRMALVERSCLRPTCRDRDADSRLEARRAQVTGSRSPSARRCCRR